MRFIPQNLSLRKASPFSKTVKGTSQKMPFKLITGQRIMTTQMNRQNSQTRVRPGAKLKQKLTTSVNKILDRKIMAIRTAVVTTTMKQKEMVVVVIRTTGM